MQIQDLIGDYSIIGKNQEDTTINYRGTLTLTLDNNNRIIAKWGINNQQEQVGKGFFKDNILVINFSYVGAGDELLHGVVVYRCLTKDILDGFWSEEYGNPKYIGEERCFRIKDQVLD